MNELCKKIYNENIQSMDNWAGYEYIGLRFDDKEREVGEICEYSRYNNDREVLDGTTALDLSEKEIYQMSLIENREADCSHLFNTKHCYIVAGNTLGSTSDGQLDENEFVIKGALVIAQIF